MECNKTNLGISAATERSLKSFREIFEKFMENCSASIQESGVQKSFVADVIIWHLQGDGFHGKLPFTYGDAYLAVGIPKEFLK